MSGPARLGSGATGGLQTRPCGMWRVGDAIREPGAEQQENTPQGGRCPPFLRWAGEGGKRRPAAPHPASFLTS